MQALVFDGKLRLREIPIPRPKRGEALVRVRWSAICNTDLEIVRGYMGFRGVLGHEFVGEVASRGSRWFGKTVVGEINCACGKCDLCRRGLERHCGKRTVLGIYNRNGAFADYLVLPERNLHPVPAGLAPETAVFTEPLAAALEIVEQVRLRPADRVFIFGAGKLGLLVGQVIRRHCPDMTLLDPNPDKVRLARELGLVARPLASLPARAAADLAVDCTGHPRGVALALDHLRPRGALVLKTTVAKPARLDLNRLVINEQTLIGSRCGPFAPALALLRQGRVRVAPLVDQVFSFTDIVAAFAAARKKGRLKILIRHP